jgi:hypothetical protein
MNANNEIAVLCGTPRKLPKIAKLTGRVVVLDIAFAAEGAGSSFARITEPFIDGLGDRLALWIDHHDHAMHSRYAADPRFVLCNKRDHGACPEMVTKERVERAGIVNTVVCHDDLDGLYSAAKWLLGGVEPYAGADDDARAVDTRIGPLSPTGLLMDRALRGRPKDEALRLGLVRYLAEKMRDVSFKHKLEDAAAEFALQEERAIELAQSYVVDGPIAVVDASSFVQRVGTYDKTLALMLGQKLARVSVVFDDVNVTVAAAFDSNIDLLKLFSIDGGMPTRVSVHRNRLEEILKILRQQLR